MGARRVTGVDISDQMVDLARKQQSVKENYVVGDANCLSSLIHESPTDFGVIPGADLDVGCFDLAVGAFVFNYVNISKMNSITSQIFSILKPGGHFIFSVPHPSTLTMGG